MTAAVFGLLGVIVGGVLNGVVSYALDLGRDVKAAKAAARLLRGDFMSTAARMAVSRKHGRWGSIAEGRVPVEAWRDHRYLLAQVLTEAEWEKVETGALRLHMLADWYSPLVAPEEELGESGQDILRGSGEDLDKAARVLGVFISEARTGALHALIGRGRERKRDAHAALLDEESGTEGDSS